MSRIIRFNCDNAQTQWTAPDNGVVRQIGQAGFSAVFSKDPNATPSTILSSNGINSAEEAWELVSGNFVGEINLPFNKGDVIFGTISGNPGVCWMLVDLSADNQPKQG